MSRPRSNRRRNGARGSERDSLDFRDWLYEPALVSLPEYALPRKNRLHVMNQGEEGACTGFGLAALVNLLIRERGGAASERVSPRMLYEMARRHDRWPGHRYDGSTARGAMKGWAKNGVCAEEDWPYDVEDPGTLSDDARASALRYPLGAYYRVLPKRSDLHAALVETGVVFATAATHRGWDEVEDGMIPFDPKWPEQGGHAFAIVGYTHEGFLIQNSWGEDWGGVEFDDVGYPGCALWQPADFDAHVWDLWVARLARPYESLDALARSTEKRSVGAAGSRPARRAPPRDCIRDHFIHIDDGQFDPHGDYWTSEGEAQRIVAGAVSGGARHIVFYAHGGLNSVNAAAERVEKWSPVFAANGIHEIHFIWETGLVAELRDVLLGKQEFVAERAGGPSDWTDRWIERSTGPLGRGLWHEMLSDAEVAFAPGGAGTRVLELLGGALSDVAVGERPKLHLVGHSAGSVLLGRLLTRWRDLPGASGHRFENLVLFAPACSHAFYEEHILPALGERAVVRLHNLLLDDERERNDQVALVYRKSLLYLVSRAYQKRGAVVPILGMERALADLPDGGASSRVRHHLPTDRNPWTASDTHAGFDDDLLTLNSTLRAILGAAPRRPFRAADLAGA